MIINNNIGALNAWRTLTNTGISMTSSLKRLSSGLKINSAADDAAGLAIAQKMQAQINGMQAAQANAQNAVSMLQTAEGALGQTQTILQRMRQLAEQAATDSMTMDDRKKLQTEMNQLAQEVTRIANTTQFNTKNLLDGTLSGATIQIGANAGQSLSFSIGAMDAYSLGVAGQTISGTLGATTGLGNRIDKIENVGSGFTGTAYKVVITGTATASAFAATAATAGTGNTGTYASVNVTGTYLGEQNANIQVKVAGVNGAGEVTAVQYSLDGGTTWSASQNVTPAASVSSFQVASTGLTFDIDTTATTAAVGDTFSIQATAARTTLQLQDSAGNNIGEAKTVYFKNGSTDVTVTGLGDASKGQTVDVHFNAVPGDGTRDFTLAYTEGGQAATAGAPASVKQGLDITSASNASVALKNIDAAIDNVSTQRANLGALQNRLQYTVDNLSLTAQNLTDAKSRVTDADMALEMSTFTKFQILQQAGVSMLAQANSMPQALLKLLQ